MTPRLSPRSDEEALRQGLLLEHPAIEAWAKLQPERVTPTGIARLQNKIKGCVYRLEGVGPGGSDVIAKCSSPERIRVERTIYEQVLPGLPISAVRYYGCIEAPQAFVDGCGLMVDGPTTTSSPIPQPSTLNQRAAGYFWKTPAGKNIPR
jgi:hypothetical protein